MGSAVSQMGKMKFRGGNELSWGECKEYIEIIPW